LNLVSDAIALWFGIFVIDIALERQRAEERKPAHQAMVMDLLRLRMPITHILFLLLKETATKADLPVLREALAGNGDVAAILARRALAEAAPARMLGILDGRKPSWKTVVFAGLSPQALRLDVLIARYVSVADVRLLAALQGLETCLLMDLICGRMTFEDVDHLREVMWRSLIQSLDKLDVELRPAMEFASGAKAVLGRDAYMMIAIEWIEQEGRA
jgi:hypothetical protein